MRPRRQAPSATLFWRCATPALLGLLLLVSSSFAAAGAAAGAAKGHGNFQVHAAASTLTGPVPLKVVFTGTSQGGSGAGAKFNWTLGGDQAGHGHMMVHVFNEPGSYPIMLQGTDNVSGEVAFDNLTVSATSSTGGTPGPSSPGSPVLPLSLPTSGSPLLVLVLGLVLAAAIGAVLVARRRRNARPRRSPPPKGASGRGRASTSRDAKAPPPSPSPKSSAVASLAASTASSPASRSSSSGAGATAKVPPTPRDMAVIWIRQDRGPWRDSGSVPRSEVDDYWQRALREAMGLREQGQLLLLPPGKDPNRSSTSVSLRESGRTSEAPQPSGSRAVGDHGDERPRSDGTTSEVSC